MHFRSPVCLLPLLVVGQLINLGQSWQSLVFNDDIDDEAVVSPRVGDSRVLFRICETSITED